MSHKNLSQTLSYLETYVTVCEGQSLLVRKATNSNCWFYEPKREMLLSRLHTLLSDVALKHFRTNQTFFRQRRIVWQSIQEPWKMGTFGWWVENLWVFRGFDACDSHVLSCNVNFRHAVRASEKRLSGNCRRVGNQCWFIEFLFAPFVWTSKLLIVPVRVENFHSFTFTKRVYPIGNINI